MDDFTGIAAIGVSFAAGLLSFLSPCVLPLMPAYISLISGVSVEDIQAHEAEDPALRHKVMLHSLGFVLGFSSIFVILGASATALGRVLRVWHFELFGVSVGVAQLAGVVIILMGLHIAGWLPIMAFYQTRQMRLNIKASTYLGTFVVGACFAFAWSPCVGPILGGILTIAGSRDTVMQGIGLLSAYSAGLAVPFLLTGYSLQRFLQVFEGIKNHFNLLEKISGIMLILIGALVASNQFIRISGWFGFLNDWVSALEEMLL